MLEEINEMLEPIAYILIGIFIVLVGIYLLLEKKKSKMTWKDVRVFLKEKIKEYHVGLILCNGLLWITTAWSMLFLGMFLVRLENYVDDYGRNIAALWIIPILLIALLWWISTHYYTSTLKKMHRFEFEEELKDEEE